MFVRIVLYLLTAQFIWNFDDELEMLKRNQGIGRRFYIGLGLMILSIILIIGDLLFVLKHNVWLFGLGFLFILAIIIFSFLQSYFFGVLSINKRGIGKELFSQREKKNRFLQLGFRKHLIEMLPTRMPDRIDYVDGFLKIIQRKANLFLYLSWGAILLLFALLLIVRFYYSIL